MRKFFLTAIVSLSFISGSAQEYFFKEINALKFAPLHLIDPINPGLEFSFEKQIFPFASIQLTGGHLHIFMKNISSPITNLKGMRWALETKYFLAQARKSVWYVSFEPVYLKSSYNTILNFSYYDDSISVKKQTLSFNFKTGFYFDFKPLVIEFYAGIGFKSRNVKHYDRLHPDDAIYNELLPYNPHYFASLESKKLKLIVPMGFRVGYNF
jgi:hypothetical protein